MEALWASLDKERPSGDDPKRVVFALQRFYSDLQAHLKKARRSRWKTSLFRELEPGINKNVSLLLELTGTLARALPQADLGLLENLRTTDESLRRATASLEKEELEFGLPVHPSPKLNQLNYLFEGWRRRYLPLNSVREFSIQYGKDIAVTKKELATTKERATGRESETETEAIELAVNSVAALADHMKRFTKTTDSGAEACVPIVNEILELGKRLGEAFQTLEQCAPLKEPCPFCGGVISLSGRCRSCSRRLPHLEQVEPEEGSPQSTFLSQNCRALDLAVLKWETNPKDLGLWKKLQTAVREFASHVTQGRQSMEMLALAQDRPIDPDSAPRQNETRLQQVGAAYQEALTTLAKFSEPNCPPESPLDPSWREPLKAAELELQSIQQALQPTDEKAT
jgi:hypothetical protein